MFIQGAGRFLQDWPGNERKVESKKDRAEHRPGLAFLEQIDILRCREGADHLPNLANLKDNEI
jgi:hypothetical protein